VPVRRIGPKEYKKIISKYQGVDNGGHFLLLSKYNLKPFKSADDSYINFKSIELNYNLVDKISDKMSGELITYYLYENKT
jgi:hypothetical protein